MGKYFIIVDMQNDFCTGNLKNDAAVKIIKGIADKAKELEKKGYTIIATRDTHNDKYMETQEGKNLPVPHCIRDTKGWEVVDELKPFIDYYVDKPSFGYNNWDAFFANELNDVNPEVIEMSGICTGICVASNFTILKALFPETPIVVHQNLCACLNDESHKAAIKVMEVQQAILR
jgi:nicotinamidase-related amidase